VAKEDFCFTYYDGDALRDMSHMNRLERGAYNDLVLQQRKFGWLTIEQIKKILGRDFDEVWPSVNLVLVFSEAEQKYYIDWLAKSIEKMRTHAKHQSDRGKKNRKQAEDEPNINQTETESKPNTNLKGDGNGDGNSSALKIIKESSLEKIEERLKEVYTDHNSGDLKMAYRDVDVDEQWPKFQVKVRVSPDCYSLHSTEGLRMAFQRHLEGATKKSKNNPKGISKDKLEQFRKK
jgi:hypothetical protein